VSAAEREINALMALHPKGFDLSLGRITRLLERLGNPHEKLPPVIHIAGTNGKGSTSAFCRAILEAQGSRSTFIHHRIWSTGTSGSASGRKAAGKLVGDEVLADAVRRVAEANRGETITVFEILTAVMFVLFSEHPADAAVVEVGLGGRFDATNVIANPGCFRDHVDFARSPGLSGRPGGTDRGGKGGYHQAGISGGDRRSEPRKRRARC
jgi:dihydrofolate synthase/folylpolyglutamate synthase